jgi:hypothetical protein
LIWAGAAAVYFFIGLNLHSPDRQMPTALLAVALATLIVGVSYRSLR